MRLFVVVLLLVVLSAVVVAQTTGGGDVRDLYLVDTVEVQTERVYYYMGCDEYKEVYNVSFDRYDDVCVSWSLMNYSVFGTALVHDGKVRANGLYLMEREGFCGVVVDDVTVHFVSKRDGVHLGDCRNVKPCDVRGGQSCEIVKFKSLNTFDSSFVNSDKYVEGETPRITKDLGVFERI